MGVRVDEVAGSVSVPTRPVALAAPAPDGEGLDQAAVFAIDARVNNSVRLVNQFLTGGVAVERLAAPLDARRPAMANRHLPRGGHRPLAAAGPARGRLRRRTRARALVCA